MDASPADDALVLLHGLAGSSRWWRRVSPLLAQHLAVHRVDLPRGYTVATAPELVLAALDRLGLERVHLAGHSLGGLVAARVAARAPERVGRLALIAPAGVGLPRSTTGMALPLARTLVALRPAFMPLLALDALRVGPLRLFLTARELLADDLRAELRQVRAPTLLVWGGRDALVPPALAEQFLAELPDARLEVIARAGHVPMEDAPEEVAAALLAWCRAPGGPGG